MKSKMGKQNMDFITSDDNKYIKTSAGLFPKIMNPKSIEEDIKSINPNYSMFNRNYNMNCGNCSLAFEMRQRGFDVKARGNPNGMTISQLGQFFSGLKSESFIQMDVNETLLNTKSSSQRGKSIQNLIASNISKQYSEDARGMLFVPHIQGAHWINWVKEGNEVKFYDGQNPKVDLVNNLFAFYKYDKNAAMGNLTSIRLDDLQVNNSIKNMVEDVAKSSTRSNFDTYIEKGKNFVMNY